MVQMNDAVCYIPGHEKDGIFLPSSYVCHTWMARLSAKLDKFQSRKNFREKSFGRKWDVLFYGYLKMLFLLPYLRHNLHEFEYASSNL